MIITCIWHWTATSWSRNPTKVQITENLNLDGVANNDDLSAVFNLSVIDDLGGPLLNYIPQH